MAIIGAVDSKVWRAIAGAHQLETVGEVAAETQRGKSQGRWYVEVTDADIALVRRVYDVDDALVVDLELDERVDNATGLDAGERHLIALARQWASDGLLAWRICTHDRAAIRALVCLGLGDHLVSVEHLVVGGGQKPRPPLQAHLCDAWLQAARTDAILASGSGLARQSRSST